MTFSARRTAALLAATAALAAPASASAGATKPLFQDGFDAGVLTNWHVQQAAPGRVSLVSATAANGGYATRFEVRKGDYVANGNRAEIYARGWWDGWGDPPGSERWYGWSTLIPTDYPADKAWQVLLQWKGDGSSGSPPLALGLDGQTLNLTARSPASPKAMTKAWKGAVRRGVWDRYMLHVKWSNDAKVGFVELYRGGQLVLPRQYRATMWSDPAGRPVPNYLKVGLYRSAGITPTQVVYHDDVRIGTRRRQVR